jgi:NarL family two-component system response regulator LiaR
MTPKPIRVLIVDDHEIVRQGIRAILSESEDIEVVAEASDGLAAIQQVKHTKPDVILMDLIMPNMDGVEAIRRITNQQPEVRILVITTYSGDDMVFPAIKAAIRQVHSGEPSLNPDIARKLMQEVSQPKPANPTPDPLTPREVEVLGLLARGMENHEIADQLVIAEVTVRSHISRILDKLHLANRVQATLYAMREGLVDMDDVA